MEFVLSNFVVITKTDDAVHPVHRFPEIPVGFPEILLILTNPTIPSEKLVYAYVSRFFPLGNLRSLLITIIPGKLVKISEGKKSRKTGKIAGKE